MLRQALMQRSVVRPLIFVYQHEALRKSTDVLKYVIVNIFSMFTRMLFFCGELGPKLAMCQVGEVVGEMNLRNDRCSD
jgi:hypothetical protein